MANDLKMAAGLAAILGAFDSGADYRAMQARLPKSLSQRIREALRSRNAKSTAPEELFQDMIKAREVAIIRRRGKCPLLVRTA